MCVSRFTGGKSTNRANLSHLAIDLVDDVLTIDDKRIGKSKVTVREDLFVRFEFDDEIGDVLLLIDCEDEDLKVFEITHRPPANIAVVEAVGCWLRFDGSCHSFRSPCSQESY